MINLKQEFNKRPKLVAFIILGISLLVVDLRLLIGPAMVSIRDTGPKVKELQRRYAFAKSAVVNIPAYREQIKQFNSRLSLQQKRFSTKQEISSMLKELSNTARNSGVKIEAVKPHESEKASAEEAYRMFPISIKAVCGFHQLGVFLNNLENADTFMRVADIRITSDPTNIKSHQVYILVNTYVISGVGES